MIPVLFIAFEFPPLNNGGVFRPYYFAKYLPEFGVKPIICTLHQDSITVFFKGSIIENKMAELPASTEVVGIAVDKMPVKSKLQKFFEIRDRDTDLWEEAMLAAMPSLIKKYSPKALVVTAPPFSMASLGRKIAVQFKLPFLLDMRDAWTYWNVAPYRTPVHYLLTKTEERKCFETAKVITTTSQQTLNDFKLLHPSVDVNKFHLIYNGFDSAVDVKEFNLPKKEKYIIGYSGGFYYTPESRKIMFAKWWQKKPQQWPQYVPRKEDWLYRSPYFFFKALSTLRNTNKEIYDKIEVEFIGVEPDWFADMVNEFELKDKVKHLGRFSHKDSIKFQQQCDILLITSAKIIGGKDYSIAGKTYEYISMQKPVLGFVCEGAQKDILQDAGVAVICNPDNDMDNANKMIELIKGNINLMPDKNFIDRLTRKNLTAAFADIIKQKLV